jgi:hypothetical protein
MEDEDRVGKVELLSVGLVALSGDEELRACLADFRIVTFVLFDLGRVLLMGT